MSDAVIDRVMELAQPARPELYRRYLSVMDRERLSALAVALEADAKKPATTPQGYWRVMGARVRTDGRHMTKFQTA